VPTEAVDGYDVIVVGRWPRIAMLHDEEWQEGMNETDPFAYARRVSESTLRAEIFSVAGELDRPVRGDLFHEMDNVAVINTNDFSGWWTGLPQSARKNARRAKRRGVEMRSVALDESFARGIKAIYDETPLRQGRPFWHYGKDIEQIIHENGTYGDRCEFLGAYVDEELIGFMKWVYVDRTARIMQILCLNSHQDKRPSIALIVRAAEICSQNGIGFLIYGKYTYGRKEDASITIFKKRLGFVQKDFPRYYLPLTVRGELALKLRMHRHLNEVLPASVIRILNTMRAKYLAWRRGALK